MKIAVCGTSYFDKRLCGNIEFVCKKHYRTGVRQLQRHKTLPNRIAVEFFCQIF